MANSKQKPTPEGSQRRPGKTKFAIPRREAPPIDGSYLDRLFADYNKQTKELEGQAADTGPEGELAEGKEVTASRPVVESAVHRQVAEEAATEAASPRPPDVTIPFRPHEVVPTEPERTDDLSPAVPTAIEPPGIRPTAATGRSPTPPPDVTVVGVDDEPLLERWKKRHRLSKGEVKVLRVMARMCRESGGDHCYVKIPQLMADAELKERQTQLVLRSLRELGLVERVAEYSNADRMGTKYRILFEAE